jgi:hypothetical protein
VLLATGSGQAGARPLPVVRIAVTGDVAMIAGPADAYFRAVGRDLSGDVVLGNLEGTLTERGSPRCDPVSAGCFTFHAPPAYAR